MVYAGVLALFVINSPAFTTLERSFASSARVVLVTVLLESIEPPLHQMGVILALIGVVLATRVWAVLLGLLGCVLWGGTGMIMTGLLVT